MIEIVITGAVAEKLAAIAQQENRPVEEVLEKALAFYPLTMDRVLARMEAEGIIAPRLKIEGMKSPMSEEEAEALAERLGKAGALSKLVIEERQEGW